MMRIAVHLLSVVAASLVVACAASSEAQEQTAVIVQASAQSRAALQLAINSVFGASHVILAEDALTRESTLIIEAVRPRDSGGQPLQGRETRLPEKFLLVKEGRRCILVQERTGKRQDLSQTRCAVVPQ